MSRKLLNLNTRQLTVVLSVGLMIKTSTIVAQEENYLGYRHEYYNEDGHRMNINTDTTEFDVGLAEQVRFTGQLVQDAISGATPTGAPPEIQWPFPTFKSLYTQDYNQLIRAAINDPNNLKLFQSETIPTFRAYTNYIVQNNPQLRTQATNQAATTYKPFITNPNFRSTSVPLTYLHDLRNAFNLALPVTVGMNEVTPQVAYSTESDYHSLGLSLNYARLFNQKNTTLNAGWSHNSDLVRDDTLVHWRPKTTDDILLGVNQLLDPKSYLTADFTFGQERGYLSDPYRGVMALNNFLQTNPNDAALIPENRPRVKDQEILYLGYTRYIDPLYGSADLGYRAYHDSFGVVAHTMDVGWHQKIGRHFVLSPGFRYYYQTAAKFYYILVPDFDNLPAFYSSDYRLSELQSFNFSVALTYHIVKHLSLDLSYSRYIMQGLDGVTSQSAYPSANVYAIGGRFTF